MWQTLERGITFFNQKVFIIQWVLESPTSVQLNSCLWNRVGKSYERSASKIKDSRTVVNVHS